MLMFLIFLAIAAISACIFANSSQITSELAGAATVLSLAISLVYAPWQVKLLLLVVLLIITQPLLRPRTQEPAPRPEPQEPQRQKVLQYRGISYQVTTEEEVDAAMSTGQRFRQDEYAAPSGSFGAAAGGHRATLQTAASDSRLKYRGATVPAQPVDKT